MTSPYNALNTALYTKLSGGTALTGALGGTCIYHGVAPEGAALPYVVWSYAAGGADNFTRVRVCRKLFMSGLMPMMQRKRLNLTRISTTCYQELYP